MSTNNNRPEIGAAMTSLINRLGGAFILIGVAGVLLVTAYYMVFPALVSMGDLTSELWKAGALGKACVFAVIGFTGLVGIKCAEWYRAYSHTPPAP